MAKTENGDAAIMNGEKQDNKEPKRENGRKSDGTETTHSQSSAMSKKSSKSNQYEKLAFSRQNLSDLRLIGSMSSKLYEVLLKKRGTYVSYLSLFIFIRSWYLWPSFCWEDY